MKKITIIGLLLLVLLVGNVSAFFDTPSTNVILSNSYFNVSDLNLTDYVPYTDATENVDLGAYTFEASSIRSASSMYATVGGFRATGNVISRPDFFYGKGYGSNYFIVNNDGDIYTSVGDLDLGGDANILGQTNLNNYPYTWDYALGVNGDFEFDNIDYGAFIGYNNLTEIYYSADNWDTYFYNEITPTEWSLSANSNTIEHFLMDETGKITITENLTILNNLNVTGDVYSNGEQLINYNDTGKMNQSVLGNNTVTIYSPFSYYKAGTTSGEMKLNLPYIPTDAYVTLEIELDGFGEYQSRYGAGKVIISGHVTPTGWNSSTVQTSFFNTDNTPYTLSSGFNTIGISTNSFGIGAGNSFFAASNVEDLSIKINKLTISGTNTTLDWTTGWNLTWLTAPFTSPSHNYAYSIEYWNSDNDGTGSYLDADTLDGLTSTNFFSSHSIAQYTNFSDQAVSPGLWKGTNINDSAYFPNTASGNRANIFLIGDVLADGKYTHQIECKAFQSECSIRASGSAVGVKEWLGLVTDTYLYNTSFTGSHIQIGNMNITGNLIATDAIFEDVTMGGDLVVTGKIKSETYYVDRTNNVLISSVTVVNTVTETELYCGEVIAGSVTAEEIMKVIASGTLSTDSAVDAVTLRFYIGETEKFNFTITPKNIDNEVWDLHGIATQRTIGVTGERASHLHFNVAGEEEVVDGVGTLDTTSNMNLTITAQWNNAKAGNTITINQGFMEFKN